MSVIKKQIKQYFKENGDHFEVDIFDLNKITKIIYGVSIDLVSVEKNSSINIFVDSKLSFEDLELVHDAVINEIAEKDVYNLIFKDICSKGYIVPGKYIINAYWN